MVVVVVVVVFVDVVVVVVVVVAVVATISTNVKCHTVVDSMLRTPCLKKNFAKLFLSELCQISTNFDNFWQNDGKETKVMRDALIFHLT